MLDNMLVLGLIIFGIFKRVNWRKYRIEFGTVIIQHSVLLILDLLLIGMTFEQYDRLLQNIWVQLGIVFITLVTLITLSITTWIRKRN